MAKTKISEWSATAANNTDINGIDIAEGCAPSGINNAIRELMAQVKDQQTGTDADNFTVGGNLTVNGTAAFTSLSLTGNTVVGDSSSDTITVNATPTFNVVIPVASGGTGVTTSTGTGAVVRAVSPALTTPALGTPSSGNLANCTFPTLNQNTTGSSGSCTGNAATATTAANAIGVGQTWQDVTASRTDGVTYTNSTGRPIFISVRLLRDDGLLELWVDELPIGKTGNTAGPSNYTLTAIIPASSTYRVEKSGNTLYWYELR
jgi:hypothetical protein